TPAFGDGISIVALSDSSVMSDCSLLTASPGFTNTSMTSTSLKSPMSGTSTWLMRRISYRRGVCLFRIDAVFLDRVGHGLRLDFALVGERLERRDGDEAAVDLEEVAQLRARIRAAEAVGAEHAVAAVLRNEGANLIRERLHVVARRDDRPCGPFLEAFRHVREARLRLRVQHVPALGGKAVAPQLGEAGGAPHIGGDAPVLLEQLGRGFHLAQDRAAAEELHALLVLALRLLEEIHPLQYSLL